MGLPRHSSFQPQFMLSSGMTLSCFFFVILFTLQVKLLFWSRSDDALVNNVALQSITSVVIQIEIAPRQGATSRNLADKNSCAESQLRQPRFPRHRPSLCITILLLLRKVSIWKRSQMKIRCTCPQKNVFFTQNMPRHQSNSAVGASSRHT